MILSDSAYPLKKFVMKPYTDRGDLSPQEKRYNGTISKSCVVVKNVFWEMERQISVLV